MIHTKSGDFRTPPENKRIAQEKGAKEFLRRSGAVFVGESWGFLSLCCELGECSSEYCSSCY